MDLKEYDRLKGDIDRLVANAAKAEGAHEQEMAKAKELFGVNTIEEMRDVLTGAKAELAQAEAAFVEEERNFMAKWGDKLK